MWTIGHSNHDLEWFIDLLRGQRINFAVDVRSYPYSRHAPQFNREELESALRNNGVGYLFLGDALGGRPGRDEHYDADGHAIYEEMAREPSFAAAIDRLLDGAGGHRLALMCSEADPHDCHRRLLVGKVLAERGAELRHILRDGTVTTEHEVDIAVSAAPTLFGDNAAPWRSTRSVSRRRRLSASSTG
ncbi:MAG: hypothetical protein QOI91_2707 [Solirubrobacteraceae bacterium]|nr:hypothetical protein [Solirubrobacteraceae bacterium]